MIPTFFLAPAGSSVGLTTVALGLVRAFDRIGLRIAFFKPIGETAAGEVERSTHFVRETANIQAPDPIPLEEASRYLSGGQLDELMGRIIDGFHRAKEDADVMVIEGLVPTIQNPYSGALNVALVKALSADILLVGSLVDGDIRETLELAARPFGSIDNPRLAGCILNRVTTPEGETEEPLTARLKEECAALRPGGLPLVAVIPENAELTYCRTIDVARHLDATILNEGEWKERRVCFVAVLARTVPNMLGTIRAGALLVTPTDRNDVMMAVSLTCMNRIPIAGLILTGKLPLDQRIFDLCRPAFETGLPVLSIPSNSYGTGNAINSMSSEIAIDDLERVEKAMNYVANHVDEEWLTAQPGTHREPRMSPAAFLFQLTARARAVPRRILLPEGSEPRTVRAAIYCQQQGIANCVLIGEPEEIKRVAKGQGLEIPDGLELIDPDTVRERYVRPMVELRKGKGLSSEAAADQLTDNVVLGTVMLALGEADGLVSGAVHSSANTVRPALKFIKSRPGTNVVSSIFFMCLPDHVVIYGDCAINTDPKADALADIALQSADSAEAFGITPRVAMISYSTGESGSGEDVDKVREATRIAKERRPDLLIDGPLQYDAASTMDVASKKAPDSPVAGRATVFVFPDLNTGNTTYKAVQRSANVISIGPMLQGLKRPVNDLSRGALVEDIIYTIALTAIQAEQNIDVVPR